MANKKICSERFITTYKTQFYPKPIQRTPTQRRESEFQNPITESFKESTYVDPEFALDYQEDQEIVRQEICAEKPKICKIHFPEPLDKEVLLYYLKYKKGRTIYEIDYCDIAADVEKKKKEEKLKLPDDWNIPLTTQRYSYRNPIQLSSNAYEPNVTEKPSNNLVQNEKVNEILQIKVGESEYMDRIGKLGGFIVDEQMHGKITHE